MDPSSDVVVPGGERPLSRAAVLLRLGLAALVLALLVTSAVVWRRQVEAYNTREAEELRAAAVETLGFGDGQAATVQERTLVDLRAVAVADAPAVDRRLDDDFLGLRLASRVLAPGPAASWTVAADATKVAHADGLDRRFTVHSLGPDHTDRSYELSADLASADRVRFLDSRHVVVAAKRVPPDAGEDVVEVWDLEAGTPVRRLVPNPGRPTNAVPETFEVDPSGRFLAIGEPDSRTVALIALDGSDARVDLDLGQGARVATVRGPDSVLVTLADGRLAEISPSGRSESTPPGNGLPAWSATGDVVVAGCVEGSRMVATGTAGTYWDREVSASACAAGATGLDTSRRHLVGTFHTGSGRPDVLAVWRADGQGADRRFAIPAVVGGADGETWQVGAATFADDGSGRVALRHEDTVVGLEIPPADALDSVVAAAEDAVFAPDGGTLYVLLGDGEVQSWDVREGRRLGLEPAAGPLVSGSLVLSPGGNRLAVVGRYDVDGGPRDIVTVLETPSLGGRDELPTSGTSPVGLRFDGDDHLVLTSGTQAARWELATMRRTDPVPLPPDAVHVLPAGDRVVVVQADGRVRQVRPAYGEDVPDSAFDLGYDVRKDVSAADVGAGLLAVALPDRVELWDLATGLVVDTLPFADPVAEIKITSGGDVVRVRPAAEVDLPERLPADHDVRRASPADTIVFTWSRSWLSGAEATPDTVSDLRYRVVPAPALVPRDRVKRRDAVCRSVRSVELAAERVAGLPEPARRVAACP